MTQIYKIKDNTTGECYIGSTRRCIRRRFLEHIRESNIESHRKCSSHKIIKNNNYSVELLEECKEEDRYIREQFYIDKFESVNINGATKKAYKNEHQKYKEYKNQWYKKHIDEKKKYDKIRNQWKFSFGETARDTNNMLYIQYDVFTYST